MADATGNTLALERETLRETVDMGRKVNTVTALRATAARAAGRQPGPEGGVGTLSNAELNRRRSETAVDAAGLGGVAWMPGDQPAEARARTFLRRRANTVDGTPEVARSQVGERILALLRKPGVDGGVGWSPTRR